MPPHRADPHSHSRDPPSSSRELTTLRTELELSTFLNKGILQSNAELKARIAELEAENAALRSSESQLSRTEDALEVAEKRVHRAELSAAAAERRYTDELGRVVGEQAAAERDAEAWRRKYEELAGVLVEAQRVLGRIDAAPSTTAKGSAPATAPLPRKRGRASKSTAAAAAAAAKNDEAEMSRAAAFFKRARLVPLGEPMEKTKGVHHDVVGDKAEDEDDTYTSPVPRPHTPPRSAPPRRRPAAKLPAPPAPASVPRRRRIKESSDYDPLAL